MDAVVIGGGIIGLASAYTLADQGADVVLCEKKSLGNGSTERSAGGIRTQFSTPVNVELSKISLETWRTFEAEFGTEIAHRQVGYLFLARDAETAAAFEDNVAMQNEHGIPSELLTPEEATEHCPRLEPDAFQAATYCGQDGFADPHLALQGYADAAQTVGVDIRTKTPVTDIRTRDGTVVGVETDDGRLDADVVVNAGGPWARQIAAMAGIEVPVAPKRRQVLVVDPDVAVPEDVPLTIDLDTGSYFRPEREGAALCGGHFDEPDPDQDPDAYRESFDLKWATTALERAADYTTYFGPESAIKRGWAGLYAVTPDHHPIIEETIPGFIQAIGFSGHGFQHSPATAEVVTELAFDGEASLVDIAQLQSDRFETGRLIHEQNVA